MFNKASFVKNHSNGIITFIIETLQYSTDPYFQRGSANGYIAIPANHKFYDHHYDGIQDIDIHGGWTFSDYMEIKGNKYKVFGFDTAHCGDHPDNWNVERVVREIEAVVEQF